MKAFKSSSIIIISIIALVIGVNFVLFYRHQLKCEANVQNCEKIDNGMDVETVIKIMGEPADIVRQMALINGQNLDIIRYLYEAPLESSGSISIIFDLKTKVVVHAECPQALSE